MTVRWKLKRSSRGNGAPYYTAVSQLTLTKLCSSRGCRFARRYSHPPSWEQTLGHNKTLIFARPGQAQFCSTLLRATSLTGDWPGRLPFRRLARKGLAHHEDMKLASEESQPIVTFGAQLASSRNSADQALFQDLMSRDEPHPASNSDSCH